MAKVTNQSIAEQKTADLRTNGFSIIDAAISPRVLRQVEEELTPHLCATPRSQGTFSGEATVRLGRLALRSPTSHALIEHPMVMEIVEAILGPWCDHISLNLTQAIELLPGALPQVPHRDQDMWTLSRFAPASPRFELLVNVIWPLTAFTAQNGATMLWPGSHRRTDELLIAEDEAVCARMEPGSALVFLGSSLHGAGANRTPLPRRALVFSYCLGWLKPYEIPWLAYPPAVARTFSPRLAQLVGYKVHRPNLGVFEGRCPSLLLTGNQETGAIDALLPDQESLIAAWQARDITAANFRDFVKSV